MPLVRAQGLWLTATVGLGYAVLLALHVLVGHDMSSPPFLQDEFAHFASAAYFAGYDWSSLTSILSYASWGYGLLVSPLLRLTTDPYRFYQGALFVNAICASAVFPLAWLVGRALAPRTAPGTMLLAAATVALYPSNLILADLAWAESALTAMFWVTALGFVGLVRTRRQLQRAAALGAAVGGLSVLHQRGLPVAAAAMATVLVLWAVGTLRRGAVLAFATALAVVLGIAFAVKSHLFTALWLNGAGWPTRDSTVPLIGTSILEWTNPLANQALLQVGVGQMFYLGAASALVIYVGMACAASLAARPLPARSDGATARACALYFALAAAAMWGTTTLYFRFASRGDKILYGRYDEAVIGPLLLLGLLTVVSGDPLLRARRRACVGVAALGFAILGAAAVYLCQDRLDALPIIWLNITGILPYYMPGRPLDLTGVLITVAVLSAAAFALSRVAPRLFLILIGAGFLWSGVTGAAYLAIDAEQARLSTDIPAWLQAHAAGRPIYFLRNRDLATDFIAMRYQFMLAPVPIRAVDVVEAIDSDPVAFVITARADLDGVLPGAAPIVEEFSIPLRLWAVGSARSDAAALDGARAATRYRSRLTPEGWDASPIVLPADDPLRRRLAEQPLLAGTPWGLSRVRVRVEHEDTARWPRELILGVIWEREDRPGVRLGEDRDYGRLPRSPGDAAVIDVALRPDGYDGAPLPAGRYRVTVGLVQEGVRWLSDDGDAVLTYAVVVAD